MELEKINAPKEVRQKVTKLMSPEQSLCSKSASVSLLNKEQNLGSTSDSVSDMSQVNTDNAKYECISDQEIYTLLDGMSVNQLVDHF